MDHGAQGRGWYSCRHRSWRQFGRAFRQCEACAEVVSKMGMEWFYRLCTDPKRIKRMMALPKFMSLVKKIAKVISDARVCTTVLLHFLQWQG